MTTELEYGGLVGFIDNSGTIHIGGLVGRLTGDLTNGTFVLGGLLGRIVDGAVAFGGLTGTIDASGVIRFGGITGGGTPSGPTDPDFAYVKSLLHFDGANGAQATTDIIPANTVVVGGGASGTILSTATPKWGTAALLMRSPNVGVTCQVTGPALNFNADFCVEMWFYRSAAFTTQTVLFNANAAPGGQITVFSQGDGKFRVFLSNQDGSLYTIADSAGAPSLNVYHHLALVLNGTTLKLYLDGTAIITSTIAYTPLTATNGRFNLGGATNDVQIFLGNIDDFRLTIGVPRYTANFTPPAAAFPNS